jgi:hypothetical protein
MSVPHFRDTDMRTSDTLDAIGPALAKAQGAIEPALKDRTNPAFRSKYADLTSVWMAARDACSSNGIAVLQEVLGAEDGIAVVTRLQHASGQWIEMGPTPIPVNKKDAQGTGSAITYGKRYALAAALGVVAEDDDDGNAAATARPAQQSAPAPRAASQRQAAPQPLPAGPHNQRLADFDAALDACDTVASVNELKAKVRVYCQHQEDPAAYERFVERARQRATQLVQLAASTES